MKKVVSFKLEEALVNKLKEKSEETYIPQVTIVALALEQYFKNDDKSRAKQSR